MLYLVYIKANPDHVMPQTCLLGAFMLKEDAEKFKRNHILSNHLALVEADGWENWLAIRTEAGLD